jgi:hypothetical protein
MLKVVRAAARASLVVGLLAGVSVVGATNASAASPAYTCTGSYPEVCLGVYYSGGGVTGERVQANLDHGVYYQYTLYEPNGATAYSPVYQTSSAGWGQTYPFPFTMAGAYCAVVQYGSTTSLGSYSGTACAGYYG